MNKNTLLEEDMFADATSFDKIDPIEGKRLSSLVNQLNQVTKDIQEAEDFLKTLNGTVVASTTSTPPSPHCVNEYTLINHSMVK